MSHVSPHSRSENERSQNQNAAAIFLAVAGAILFGVVVARQSKHARMVNTREGKSGWD